MREGLALGLQAGGADLQRAMAGMMTTAMAPAYAYAAPGGGRGGTSAPSSVATRMGDTINNINIRTQEPAPIAREVERTMRRLSLEKEMSAYRG